MERLIFVASKEDKIGIGKAGWPDSDPSSNTSRNGRVGGSYASGASGGERGKRPMGFRTGSTSSIGQDGVVFVGTPKNEERSVQISSEQSRLLSRVEKVLKPLRGSLLGSVVDFLNSFESAIRQGNTSFVVKALENKIGIAIANKDRAQQVLEKIQDALNQDPECHTLFVMRDIGKKDGRYYTMTVDIQSDVKSQ